MNRVLYLLPLLLAFGCQTNDKAPSELKPTVFEASEGKQTSTYFETIAYYQYLDSNSTHLELHDIGATDSPEPLHLMIWSADGKTTLEDVKNRGDKQLIFINNGIHPGEPDGIDACQLLLKRLILDTAYARENENVILAIIPIYNVGGSINRNSTTRVNQNGPEAYGFRGNAHNYDLNRDFIKMDSKNAWSFLNAFTLLKPNLFIDTHVSNGADYPYNITLLSNHKNKFRSSLETFLQEQFKPALYASMADKGEKMVPYINVHGSDPRNGLFEFLDHPRYSNGIAALHNCPAYTIETHMLKSHKVRTEATYKLLETFVATTKTLGKSLVKEIKNEENWYKTQENIPISFFISDEADSLFFEGYSYESKFSPEFGTDWMEYNHAETYAENIPYYNNYEPGLEVKKSKSYVVQGGFHQVIDRLRMNGIKGEYLKSDTIVSAEISHVKSFETYTSPFEGHYLHYATTTEKQTKNIQLRKGDFWINTEVNNVRFLAEVLEAEAPDSYFNWGFFDIILQQKEGFSGYVWQTEAAQMLKSDTALMAKFEAKKAEDIDFATNYQAQLSWLYELSDHFEPAYKRLPIFKVY